MPKEEQKSEKPGVIDRVLDALDIVEKIELLKHQRRVAAERVRLALEWKAKQ